MFIKFKNNENEYECTNAVEQKIYKAGIPTGWIFGFQMSGAFTSEELDEILNEDGISEITITDGDNVSVLSGYEKVSSCIIRYSVQPVMAEIQLTRGYNNG